MAAVLFGLQLVGIDFLPRNNLKHLVHVWSAGWPVCLSRAGTSDVCFSQTQPNNLMEEKWKRHTPVTNKAQVVIYAGEWISVSFKWMWTMWLWHMPSDGRDRNDVNLRRSPSVVLTNEGVVGRGSTREMCCCKSWQESSRVFQQVCGSISISLWLTLGHASTLINSILLTSLPPASPHRLFSIKEAKRSIGAEMRHLYIVPPPHRHSRWNVWAPPCHQMCGDVL